MYHYVYKTINLINNKYYIGVHSTSKLNDKYLGSGQIIKSAILKYGRSNFKLEILKYFETRDLALAYEKEIITDLIINDPNSYNLIPGGANTSKFGKKDSNETRIKKSVSRKSMLLNNGYSDLTKLRISQSVKQLHADGGIYPSKKKKLTKEELFELKSKNTKKRWDLGLMPKPKSGMAHHKFCGYYHTPLGVYVSLVEAAKAHNISHHTVKSRCLSEKIKFIDWYFEPITAPTDSNI
ncbi:GIY-YIG nuclease family protein [uncultured Flavobacterium sp.]|uniref:GIY-YIG nuclease family protein n=1 Tax=uncultured Flavobacterium sp. TaxID=165435 RepID=UPI002592F1F1|nr:GIY-YIG nuclease family protein [uncultured Flavobacterium sp.]